MNKGSILFIGRRYKQALAAYEEAIKLDPQNAVFYIHYGNTLSKLKSYEQALVAYEKAIQLEPENVFAHHMRGIILAQLKRYKEAEQAIDQALQAQMMPAFMQPEAGSSKNLSGGQKRRQLPSKVWLFVKRLFFLIQKMLLIITQKDAPSLFSNATRKLSTLLRKLLHSTLVTSRPIQIRYAHLPRSEGTKRCSQPSSRGTTG